MVAKRAFSQQEEDLEEGILVMPEVSEADLLIWVGDFNYRLADLSYADAINLINEKRYEILLEKDQLRAEMAAGRVFQGMREADILFPPTYKFDKGCDTIKGKRSEFHLMLKDLYHCCFSPFLIHYSNNDMLVQYFVLT